MSTRGADVEHAAAGVAEQVDAGRVRQAVGQGALAPRRLRHPAAKADSSSSVVTPEGAQPFRAARAARARWRGRRSSARWSGVTGRAEQPGQAGQLVVRAPRPAAARAAGQRHRVEHRRAPARALGAQAGGLEEADVETGVVRDQHRRRGRTPGTPAARPRVRGARADHRVGDAGEHRDERRDRAAGVHQGLELADHLAAAHLDRADLGDRSVVGASRRWSPGRRRRR